MKKKLESDSPLRAATCSASSGLARIRRVYGVPAKRGMVITYGASDGEDIPALIVGSAPSDRLRVKLQQYSGEWNKRTSVMHPTWHVTYPQNA